MKTLEPITLEEIRSARERIAGLALRTPLVRFDGEGGRGGLWLKLENLQPIGSFKIRGAGNAIRSIPRDKLAAGVYTASAGNMAQGVAFVARQAGVACSVVVPDSAPRAKIDAVRRLGARTITVPFDEWWSVMVDHRYPGQTGHFVHPVSDSRVLAGNGTIGLEIVEDLADVAAVVIPFGGGGLTTGIATAVRALRPDVRIIACEVETAAPLAAALAARMPCEVARVPSFVDGIGSRSVLPEMWPLVSDLVDESIVVSLDEVADAIRLLAERHRVIAEGAGAAALAAGLVAVRSGRVPDGRIACVISGGSIDAAKLAVIFSGKTPR